MKKASLFIACCLFFCMVFLSLACAEGYSCQFDQGAQDFPDEKSPSYRYSYLFPVIPVTDAASESIAHYYTVAKEEMLSLTLPMFSKDPDMVKSGPKTLDQRYEITCNNDQIFSTRMVQTESGIQGKVVSVQSQVFAVSGEYAGDTLTLRGLTRVGKSSEQLGQAVLKDIYRQIDERRQKGESGWLDFDSERFALDFYPETQFYADENGNAVFYLQPSLHRKDHEIMTFTYTPAQLSALIS